MTFGCLSFLKITNKFQLKAYQSFFVGGGDGGGGGISPSPPQQSCNNALSSIIACGVHENKATFRSIANRIRVDFKF